MANKEAMVNSFCGTLNCIAPEVLAHQGYGQSADIYSLGCVAYLLLVGRLPTRYMSYRQAK